MRHPTPEELKPLLNAIDTAVWCWNMKGGRVKIDWKKSLEELTSVFCDFQVKMDDSVIVTSKEAGEA